MERNLDEKKSFNEYLLLHSRASVYGKYYTPNVFELPGVMYVLQDGHS